MSRKRMKYFNKRKGTKENLWLILMRRRRRNNNNTTKVTKEKKKLLISWVDKGNIYIYIFIYIVVGTFLKNQEVWNK